MAKKIRLSNFELLRTLSILLIMNMHTRAGLVREELTTFNLVADYFSGAIGQIGVTCFILISGYFGVKFKLHRFIQLIIVATVFSLLTTYLNDGFAINAGSLMKAVLYVPLFQNWYISCYLLLMLLAPIINLAVEKIDRNKYISCLLGLGLYLSFTPSMTNAINNSVLVDGGKCATYFIYIYLIGRFIRLHADCTPRPRRCIGVHVIMTLLIIAIAIIVDKLTDHHIVYWGLDCSPLVLVSAISVFYLFKSFTFNSSIVNWIASSVLAAYLFDESRPFFHQFFNLQSFSPSEYSSLVVLVELLTIFIFAILIDKLRILLFGYIENKFIAYVSYIINRIKDYVIFNFCKHL